MKPIRLTWSAARDMVRMCRIQLPQETCGFVVADQDMPNVGTRVVWMKNIAADPIKQFLMDDDAVRAAYRDFDEAGEEPIAIFHSHPTSEPIMSEWDLRAAVDDSLAYLVVSFMATKPQVRAYRVARYIGNNIPLSIQIDVQEDVTPDPDIPPGPWALMVGNRVRISYQRTNKNAISHCVATVTGVDAKAVHLDPERKTAARMIPLERIRAVHVLHEGTLAVAVRKQLRAGAGEARALLAGRDVSRIPGILQTLSRAFPPDITISMEESAP